MSKTPNYDAAVKKILDELKPGERMCALLGTKWRMDEKEIEMYRKYNVPPSKYAPETRMKLLSSHIVVFDMWYNRHAETTPRQGFEGQAGKPMISVIHPATGIRVVSDEEWFVSDFISDGLDLNSSRPFFDQLRELSVRVPRSANCNYIKPENSLAFISRGDRNSYFVLACSSENTFYSMNANHVEESSEIVWSENIFRSYNVLHSRNISNCMFARESIDCMHSDFIFDCRNCEYCFGATNKRNKKYLWFNECISESEWMKRRAEVDLSSYSVRVEFEKLFHELISRAVWPENWNVHCEDVSGEYVVNSVRVHNGFYIYNGSHDLDWVEIGYGAPSNDCYMCSAIVGSSDCYYGVGNVKSAWNLFSLSIVDKCVRCEFCNSCTECENCFGCIGLRHKKFCILNKQYGEEEYWRKLDDIKCAMLERDEYGDTPLPTNLSTQHWSGCGAYVLHGSTKEEMVKLGMPDVEIDADGAEGFAREGLQTHSLDELPDRAENSMVNTAYFDPVLRRRFSYLAPEINFYKKLGISAPRSHPTRRLTELLIELNIYVFENQVCAKCSKPIRVGKNRSYHNRVVYCKSCYFNYLETDG
jgi:hypothetical protein